MHHRLFICVAAAIVAASIPVLSLASSGSRSAVAQTPPPAFPVTVTAANGGLTIRQEPRRIVSLSPSATESLFAIGAGPQVIAVDRFSDYPKGTPKTELSGFRPNIEAVVALSPDLVIVGSDANKIVDGLKAVRIPVLLHPPAVNLAGAYGQILRLGKVTGHVANASRLVADMRKRIATLVRSASQGARGRSVYHEVGPDRYSATSRTFIGGIYAMFGLRNIADRADPTGSGFPQLSSEYIVTANPDLIVLADITCCAQNAATVAARPGWNQIAAVRRGAIVRLDDSIAARWGPRLVNFVRAVALGLRATQR